MTQQSLSLVEPRAFWRPHHHSLLVPSPNGELNHDFTTALPPLAKSIDELDFARSDTFPLWPSPLSLSVHLSIRSSSSSYNKSMRRMNSDGCVPKRCWVTLLTSASYLPGVITLAYSLYVKKSRYPLVVLVTASLPKYSLRALCLESQSNPLLIVRPTTPLLLPDSQSTTLIAQRFEDTWTKLRAFELIEYDTCVFLDADITVYKNIDDLFDIRLPRNDWIAACHSCVCNLDHDSWAAANWTRKNCAYTPLSHPSALDTTTLTPRTEGPPHTHALLNGGVFLYHPSTRLWDQILDYFNNSSELSKFLFPDQDFLAAFFVHKWVPLSWKYNAIKTMRQWHPNIWRDEEVKSLHYIVDKPWAKRIASDGIAGHMGRDGVTHQWWWNVYRRWRALCHMEMIHVLDELVAHELDAEQDAKQCEDNRRRGFPVSIPTDQNEGWESTDSNMVHIGRIARKMTLTEHFAEAEETIKNSVKVITGR